MAQVWLTLLSPQEKEFGASFVGLMAGCCFLLTLLDDLVASCGFVAVLGDYSGATATVATPCPVVVAFSD